jgi:hypothetical protein
VAEAGFRRQADTGGEGDRQSGPGDDGQEPPAASRADDREHERAQREDPATKVPAGVHDQRGHGGDQDRVAPGAPLAC